MADTKTTEQRHDAALERIAKALNVETVDLIGEAKGDPALGRAITMENIANAMKSKTATDKAAPVAEAKS